MFVIERHIVPAGITKVRLSDYGVGLFQTVYSRKGVKKAIKKGLFMVNGIPAGTGFWVETGQVIELRSEDKKAFAPFPLKLKILYEDEDLAVVFKPGGLIVSGNQFRTLENALPFNLKPSSAKDSLSPPRCVHRLDGPTCGLVLIAKTRHARINLGHQFEHKLIRKKYRAIVMGDIPVKGIYDSPIDGKASSTKFALISKVPSLRSGSLSLIDLFPETGRTHQLRIHLSEAGFPILGDQLYGREGEVFKGKGLFLCAVELEFNHPVTQKPLVVSIDPPNKFQLQLDREERRWEKF